MRRLMALALFAGLVVTACGKGGGESGGSTGGSSSEGGGTAASSSYSYVNNGLEGTLTLTGAAGTLELVNGTGEEVGEPAVYSLDGATGERVDATVEGAAAVADGATQSFQLSFPSGFDPAASGFIGLEIGGEDYGGFVSS